MRHLLRVSGIACLAGWALIACAPAPAPPSNPVGRTISQIRNSPQIMPTPGERERRCLDAYVEHAADLPAEFIDRVEANDLLNLDSSKVGGAAHEAARALGIPRSGLSLSTINNAYPGNQLVTVQWCSSYNDQEVFLATTDQQIFHLLTVESDRSINHWIGEGMIAVWATSPGTVLRGQQVWIFEPQSDGAWEVVYEKDRMVSADSLGPSEITWGPNEVAFDYMLSSGERVIREFRWTGSNWALVDEQRIEP
jgi:hypothetical protein